MADRRAEFRNKTYLGGQIGFVVHISTPQCLVRNVSRGGAMLAFNNPTSLPGEFDLVIHKHGTHRARLVWQQGVQAGVALLDH